MRIAIVNDIASERKTLKGRAVAQSACLSLDAAVFCYASGTDFLACTGKEHLFIATFPDHALEGFRVRVLHYLVKPYQFGDYLFKDFRSFGRRA